MNNDSFEHKIKAHKTGAQALPYPEKWLLSEDEKSKLLKDTAMLTDLFAKHYSKKPE